MRTFRAAARIARRPVPRSCAAVATLRGGRPRPVALVRAATAAAQPACRGAGASRQGHRGARPRRRKRAEARDALLPAVQWLGTSPAAMHRLKAAHAVAVPGQLCGGWGLHLGFNTAGVARKHPVVPASIFFVTTRLVYVLERSGETATCRCAKPGSYESR
eukprot:356797-Chlamydomonas_euryale.AAC.1